MVFLYSFIFCICSHLWTTPYIEDDRWSCEQPRTFCICFNLWKTPYILHLMSEQPLIFCSSCANTPLYSTVYLWTLICGPWSVNWTRHILQLIWEWPLIFSRCSDLWMIPYILQLICEKLLTVCSWYVNTEHPLIFYSWYVNPDLWTTLHIFHLICEQPLILSRWSGLWMTPLCLLYLQLICKQTQDTQPVKVSLRFSDRNMVKSCWLTDCVTNDLQSHFKGWAMPLKKNSHFILRQIGYCCSYQHNRRKHPRNEKNIKLKAIQTGKIIIYMLLKMRAVLDMHVSYKFLHWSSFPQLVDHLAVWWTYRACIECIFY